MYEKLLERIDEATDAMDDIRDVVRALARERYCRDCGAPDEPDHRCEEQS